MTDFQTLVGLANAGADFQAFITGNIGSYMLKRAEQDEIDALRKLSKADPSDAKEIRRLQLEAAVPRAVVTWINDVIETGKTANWQIEQEGAE